MKNLKTLSKRYIILIAGVLFLMIVGCNTLDIKPTKPGNTVLYVIRGDAVGSYWDIIKVYLNDQFVTELKREKYAVIHLKAGKYTIKWDIRNRKGKVIKNHTYSGILEDGATHSSMITYNFGWRGWKRFPKGGSITARFKSIGEIDMSEKIKPQK